MTVLPSPTKTRSRTPTNKRPTGTINVRSLNKFNPYGDKINSTSSESSVEERTTPLQDEGYSTWSSTDVKEETTMKTNDNENNIGLVKHWLKTSNEFVVDKPMEESKKSRIRDF